MDQISKSGGRTSVLPVGKIVLMQPYNKVESVQLLVYSAFIYCGDQNHVLRHHKKDTLWGYGQEFLSPWIHKSKVNANKVSHEIFLTTMLKGGRGARTGGFYFCLKIHKSIQMLIYLTAYLIMHYHLFASFVVLAMNVDGFYTAINKWWKNDQSS